MGLNKMMLLVNFKIYREVFGQNAVKLAKSMKKVGEETGVRMIAVVPALEAVTVMRESGIETWLENVDEYNEGKHSGWVSAEEAAGLGIKGSLVNHYEHQAAKGTVIKIIKNKPKGFEIACCVKNVGQIGRWARRAKPDYIFYEPPELIGDEEKSVASEKAKSIVRAVEESGEIPLIVGAGIKSRDDVKACLNMGVIGVAAASAVVLAKDQEKKLLELAAGGSGII